jgi:hypothetical protein
LKPMNSWRLKPQLNLMWALKWYCCTMKTIDNQSEQSAETFKMRTEKIIRFFPTCKRVLTTSKGHVTIAPIVPLTLSWSIKKLLAFPCNTKNLPATHKWYSKRYPLLLTGHFTN